jgi:hypothetical protein
VFHVLALIISSLRLASLIAPSTLHDLRKFCLAFFFASINSILKQSAVELLPCKGKRRNKPKLKVWNQEIAENLTNSRLAHRAWREAGKPTHGEFIDAKKNTKILYIAMCNTLRILVFNSTVSYAYNDRDIRLLIKFLTVYTCITFQEIINARTGDTRLFHKLIKSQRKHSNQTEELLVGDDHFCGPEQILQGFKIHLLVILPWLLL